MAEGSVRHQVGGNADLSDIIGYKTGNPNLIFPTDKVHTGIILVFALSGCLAQVAPSSRVEAQLATALVIRFHCSVTARRARL